MAGEVVIKRKIQRRCVGGTGSGAALIALGLWAVPGVWGVEQPSPGVSLTNLAEQLPLEDLGRIPIESVSTASRFTQKASEAPSYVTIITAEEIKQFGYRTLADILNGVNGLYVSYDRCYSYLGLRGFNRPGDFNSRLLVMVDGHRMNDNVYEGAYIGREFVLDVDLIERVEVVRGPSSSLYGSSAFFAVVNVITKRAAAVKTLEVSAEAGSFDARKGRVTLGSACTNGPELLLSGTRYSSRGASQLYYREFDMPANNNGIADRRDGELADNLYGSLRWHDVTATAAYVYRDKDIPTASWGTLFNDPRYHFTDSHGYVDLKWDHKVDEQTAVMLRGYYDEIRYNADYPTVLETSPENLGLNRDVSLGRILGGEAQVTYRRGINTFMFGGELRRHFNQDYGNYDVAPFRQNSDVARNSYDGGGFVQDEIALTTNLLLNIGARYDYYEDCGGSLNPRVGLIYSPWDKGTFKLLYGQAFRAPSVNEIYGPWGTNSPSAGLKPERIQTYEAVYEQHLPHNLRLTLSGYYYHIDDLISPDAAGLTYVNVDKVNTKGVETELEWRHATGVRLRAGYSLQRAEDGNTGERLSNSPEQLAKFHLLVPLAPERVFTGLEILYTGQANTLPERATPHADAYWIANLTLFSQKLVEGLELSASIYNLFNTGYAVPVGAEHMQDLIYQDGRTLRVKLTYRF